MDGKLYKRAMMALDRSPEFLFTFPKVVCITAITKLHSKLSLCKSCEKMSFKEIVDDWRTTGDHKSSPWAQSAQMLRWTKKPSSITVKSYRESQTRWPWIAHLNYTMYCNAKHIKTIILNATSTVLTIFSFGLVICIFFTWYEPYSNMD